MTVSPKDAASVILVRQSANGHEALLVRKHTRLSFFGGAWVFPGGRCESSDLLPGEVYLTHPEVSGRNESIRKLVAAVCRETFEEVGILLARHRSGAFCTAETVDALQRWRDEVSRDAAVFEAMLRENDLVLDEKDFLHWANWVTPSTVNKRYDTHFFIATMPPGQEVRCDNDEATELLWQSLSDFDQVSAMKAIPAPPTRYSLADLAGCMSSHSDITSLFEAERGRAVPKLMPKVMIEEDRRITMMPWNRDYEATPGEGLDPGDIPACYFDLPDTVTRWT